ncbi:MAG: EAL domain-containing protein, partial [Bacilli bacterium]|nr:EAL domain-containing protein [Bacilli bacterium]
RMISVSVNFSMYEFYSPTFLEDVDRIIKASDINPSFIEIEITETTSQANPFLAISILKKLKEYGLKILMDDFGIGYSNLSTLSKVPFDTVKIDKTFIDGIISDLKTREIIRFLISLCKTNGMEVIAEGVDKQEQVEILKKLKCDTIQGYYYSEPLPREEFEQFLIDNPFEKIGDVKAQEQEKEDKK